MKWLLTLLVPLYLTAGITHKEMISPNIPTLLELHGLKTDISDNKNHYFSEESLKKLGEDYIIFPANQLSQESENLVQCNTLTKKWAQRANLTIDLVNQVVSEKIHFNHLQDDGQTLINKNNETFLVLGGLCSASSLEFAKTYLDLKKEMDPQEIYHFIHIALKATVPVKDGNNPKLACMQSAMNMIVKNHPYIDHNSYTFRLEKMKALLAFQNLKVVKGYPQLFTSYLHPLVIQEWLNGLENGVYALRLVRLSDNYKGEHYGHTLIFIKENEISFFFDPNLGCVVFFKQDDPALFLFHTVFNEAYSIFRALGLNGIATFYKIQPI